MRKPENDERQTAAKNLTDDQRKSALENRSEYAREPEAGVIRQILGEEQKPLTAKQQNVYDNYIEPSLVEKCAIQGCKNLVPAGTDFCPNCEVEYGG